MHYELKGCPLRYEYETRWGTPHLRVGRNGGGFANIVELVAASSANKAIEEAPKENPVRTVITRVTLDCESRPNMVP